MKFTVDNKKKSQMMKDIRKKLGANPEWKDETWLEIPEYFEHFDEIVAQIEERTGLKTINKVRPFETYK